MECMSSDVVPIDFLKVHDSTSIGKLARFPVPGMIYLVLNGL